MIVIVLLQDLLLLLLQVCTYPGYQSLYELAEAKGCKLSWWEPALAESGSTGSSSSSSQSYRQFKFDLQDFEVGVGNSRKMEKGGGERGGVGNDWREERGAMAAGREAGEDREGVEEGREMRGVEGKMGRGWEKEVWWEKGRQGRRKGGQSTDREGVGKGGMGAGAGNRRKQGMERGKG